MRRYGTGKHQMKMKRPFNLKPLLIRLEKLAFDEPRFYKTIAGQVAELSDSFLSHGSLPFAA
jgi:hypothetical protein